MLHGTGGVTGKDNTESGYANLSGFRKIEHLPYARHIWKSKFLNRHCFHNPLFLCGFYFTWSEEETKTGQVDTYRVTQL